MVDHEDFGGSEVKSVQILVFYNRFRRRSSWDQSVVVLKDLPPRTRPHTDP